MKFKKLVFENHSGDYIADAYYNMVTIFKRKDVFVLLCFGSVFEFETFEEAEIKANEENQKHLEKTLQEFEKYIDFTVSKLTAEEYEEISKKFGKDFEIGRVE